MSKPQAKSVQDKVDEWVNSHGVRLEARVAGMTKAAGLFTSGNVVLSAGDGPDIEIDVLGSIQDFSNEADAGPIRATVHWAGLVVECKYLKRPWVLVDSVERPSGLVSIASFPASGSFNNLAGGLVNTDIRNAISDLHTIAPGRRVDSAVMEALKRSGDTDMAYRAGQQIARACSAVLDTPIMKGQASVTTEYFIVPAIVLRGQLYRAVYNFDEDRFDVEEASFGRVRTGIGGRAPIVDVMTETEYCERIHGYKTDLETLLRVRRDCAAWIDSIRSGE